MHKTKKAWIITLVGALFFFYSFFQINMMNSLTVPLSKAFNISSGQLGLLSALSFYSSVLFLLPAGLLLDRFSIRKIFVANMAIVILATLVFAVAPNIYWAAFARILTGIMMSFGLIACLKLASLYLPSHHMALASSLVVTIGMLGAIASQIPLMLAINILGWRGALVSVAILGLIILGILTFFVKHPHKDLANLQAKQQGIFFSLIQVMKSPQNWLAGWFTALLNLPVAILGALFGTIYLNQVYDFSPIQASSIVTMLFVGMIVGSPFFGWFSDGMKRRKFPMAVGTIICFGLVLIVLYSSHLNPFVMHSIFFLIGFTSAAQVLGYPVIAESNKPHLTGTALSLVAIFTLGGGYGLGLPFVGWLLDHGFQGYYVQGVKIYSEHAFRIALLTIPIGIVLSFLAVVFMKETRCKTLVKD